MGNALNKIYFWKEEKNEIEEIKKDSQNPESDEPINIKQEKKIKQDNSINILNKKLLLDLKLINKLNHSNYKEQIEDVIIYPDLENTIIIGCRGGDIKEISEIIPNDSSDIINSKITILYTFSKRLYSLILLKNNNNKFCVGLLDEIIILKLIFDNGHKLEKEIEFSISAEGPLYLLLELQNGNILSAGKNIILWKKKSDIQYDNIKKIPIGNNRIINLIEFPFSKTILATQDITHLIFLIKNDENTIYLINKIDKIPSIWYKGSAQSITKSGMLLIGKFELNVIDPVNGEIISRYPNIGKDNVLNISKNFWIISDFLGKYFEFYEQEGNDLIYYDKIELEEKNEIKLGNRLYKLKDNYFVCTNLYN